MTSALRAIKFAFQNFGRNFWLSVITVSMLAMTLVTVNVLVVLQQATEKAISYAENRIEVSVYFFPATTEDRIRNASGYLQGLPQVRDVVIITSDEALQRFKDRHAADDAILQSLDAVGGNPFGPTLIIKAHTADDFPFILSALDNPQFRNDIREKDFSSYEDIIERIRVTTNRVQMFGLALSGIFLLIAVLIVFNTVRIGIFIHREEIGIMKLVGATNAFVRAPFLIECVLYSALAVGLVAAVVYPSVAAIDPQLGAFFGGESAGLFDYFVMNWYWIFGGQFLALTLINMLATGIAMRKYLKV
ncbi:FtsX-like permease family protein [bacterium]|nr:FtsX-like permease family protein [bacterium]